MSATLDTATRPATTARTRAATRVAVGAAVGLGLALVADTVAYALGNLGSPVRVVTGWAPDGADLSYGELVSTAAVAIALGAVALWVLDRRGAQGFRVWAIMAAVVAVLSAVPLFHLDVDLGSKLTLASMHLLTGAAAIAGQAFIRMRQD